MIGGLQLRALHRELVGGATGGAAADGAAAGGADSGANTGRVNPATGARWTEREFHNAVLAQNSMPVKLIRAALLSGPGTPELTRDGPPVWRFAGDL